jgi:parvulin-like peptidyl-prolyl isomerase
MKERLPLPFLLLAALILGLAASELLYRSAAFRNVAGRLSGRGRLIVMANDKGIYETDLADNEGPSATELVVMENLRRAAGNETADSTQVDLALGLLQAQFGTEKLFRNALRRDALSITSLREKLTNQLRGLSWLEKQVTGVSPATEQECHRFYDTHRDLFTQPVRFRATHVFLAAHRDTPPDVVEEKELAIAAVATRLSQGEALSELAREASEDLTTKSRGGDLSYFADSRTPPDFMAEIKKLRADEISKPFRTRLGFHIVQLTETRDVRALDVGEARSEIALALANDLRASRLDEITAKLSAGK